jgi:transcriptional regulator with XRE-family HTH domain
MLVRISFGTVIRENRRKLGLTQEQVAHRIGVSTPFVGHLESSKRRPSHHTVGLLADVLGLDESELFLTAYPEAAKLVGGRGENRTSSAWDEFLRQNNVAELDPKEIELLSRVAAMGRVRSPRDFVYILYSVRQALGREVLPDFGNRKAR